MLEKNIIKQVLGKALSTGGDFAEIFVEDSINNNISLVNGKIDGAVAGRDFGIGIRIFKGLKSVYAYTNDKSLEGMLETAYKASCAIGELKEEVAINIMERINTNIHPILYVPSTIQNANKIEVMKRTYKSAKDYSKEITQVIVNYLDKDQKVLIANSDGLFTQDRRIRTRIHINSIASNGIENQVGFEAPGRFMGFEMFDSVDVEHLAKEASKSAVTMLHAKNCPAGKMMVAIENGFGGVIFHEACGHALEATSVAKGNSVFCDKMGKQIASTKVTAIDDGTMKNLWGSLNIDDEGTKTRRNVLIEDGILKSYMIDKLNARRMNMEETGSSRRESYRYAPTSRMTNTYIDNGNDDNDDILASIDEGLYAKKMGGGSVNPITGEFNFAVAEGYLIKNGKIQEPVRGASLIGKGSEILMNIDMVGKNLAQGQGMCGSSSGSIPTNVGQPLIRVSNITVGGR
ncbi:TldD/PmbA family protein [Clostridium algidicarnis]|uniref:Microcin-processing peptidase 2 n=1 Tax=Clostridium algidicarnis DSM 15099 TaxID=1121295 RepID=A0A2S6FWU7_9CLOT|nr:TldD/PmbA family protein [Clostridium algidicarnis]PPK47936.1 microcin-processing peptidase 2 [Clostridium algidicarnis DSM 15099]